MLQIEHSFVIETEEAKCEAGGLEEVDVELHCVQCRIDLEVRNEELAKISRMVRVKGPTSTQVMDAPEADRAAIVKVLAIADSNKIHRKKIGVE